jgi:hypothetical protein
VSLIEYHGGEISLVLARDKEPFTMTLIGRGPEDPTKIIQTTFSGPAIQFENCLFNFSFQTSPPTHGQRLSTSLLAQNASSVSPPCRGRRNTSSKSICRSINSQSRSRALIQTEQLPCLVLIEYSWTVPRGSIVGSRCCIDQLSWQPILDKQNIASVDSYIPLV